MINVFVAFQCIKLENKAVGREVLTFSIGQINEVVFVKTAHFPEVYQLF